jgi:hypothetical protein
VRPRLLDLYAGAGGCTKGYQLAGFAVDGVDTFDQPNYCGEFFYKAGALAWLEHFLVHGEWPNGMDYTAVHASPPCQHYANVTIWRGDQESHPGLIAPTRELLEQTGLPWVIENVRTKALRADFMLCGSQFGLPVRRHRYFETNWSGLVMNHPCRHLPTDLAFEHKQERAYADAMGCEWMTNREAREAIPPAYCEFVGSGLLAHLQAQAAA